MTKESAILDKLRSFHRKHFPDRFNLTWLRGRHDLTEAEAKKVLARFKSEREGEP